MTANHWSASTELKQLRYGAYLALFVISLVAVACSQQHNQFPTSSQTQPETLQGEVVKGFGISPLGFPTDYSHFNDFLQEVGQLPNGGVMFNGAWRQDATGGSDAGEIPAAAITIMEASALYGYTPIIVFGWHSDGDLLLRVPMNPANDWTNEEAKHQLEQMLVDFASGYHPPFLFLGNENDAYYSSNPEDYARWVEFYNRAYDAIKAVSPETQIGPIFQYERLSGQGAFNQWITPQWGALEEHDLSKVDLVGITLYPWLGVAAPEDIPDAYLDPLLERLGDKPLAITETGWPGDEMGLITAWEAGPDAQLRYIDALRRVLKPVNLRLLNWLHLYQMTSVADEARMWQVFSSISLRDSAGNKRPIYDAWVQFQP